MLLALSVALLQGANRDLGVSVATNHAVGLLRAAHQRARGECAPAWVVLDTKQNGLYLLTKETYGEWHCEDTVTTGAFGRDGKVSSGATLVPGRVGKGFQVSSSGAVNCGEVRVDDPEQGIAIEFWFLRRSGSGRAVLATVGDLVEISAEGDGRVEARVGGMRVSSGGIRLPLQAWCYLQLVFSGRDLRLFLNQRQVAQAISAARVEWTAGMNFVFGDPRSGLVGIIDEVRLSLVIPRDFYTLPSEAVFRFKDGFKPPDDGRVVIGFDQEGRLDPAYNPEEFQFWIKSPADEKQIVVGVGGNIQGSRPEPPVPGK